MKYTNFKRYKFSTIGRYIDNKIYKISNIYKQINIKKLNFAKIYKYIDIRNFKFSKFNEKISLKNYRYFPLYLILLGLLWGILYISIPLFYNYSKSEIENVICRNTNAKCVIKGKFKYNLFPSPRIKIHNLIVNETSKVKTNFLTAESVALKLSLKNLLKKKKQTFKEIIISDFNINFDLNKINSYKKIFQEENSLLPITWKKGQVIFSEKENYIATVKNINGGLVFEKKYRDYDIKGKFLDNNLYLLFRKDLGKDNPSTKIIFKIPSLDIVAKFDTNNFNNINEIKNGQFLLQKDKNNFTGIFDYTNNEIKIIKSNLRNYFLDGKVKGKIAIKPFFNFDLNVDLNSLNFTKIHNYVLSLDEDQKKKLFTINNKINGNLTLSSNKVYSKHNLVKSFESRLKINNGNILIDQFLFNLGKFGAADILGSINNDKKFTNFKFESNIFVDNEKKFLSKFGVYNKKNTPLNYFISGNIDLINFKSSFYEIAGNEKYAAADVDFIEEQFNDLMLEDDYGTLFNFQKFQEFIKIITSEDN